MNLSLWLNNEEIYVKRITWQIVSVVYIVVPKFYGQGTRRPLHSTVKKNSSCPNLILTSFMH